MCYFGLAPFPDTTQISPNGAIDQHQVGTIWDMGFFENWVLRNLMVRVFLPIKGP